MLAGCAAPGLDHDEEVASQRTCASLRERVANRALAPFGLVPGDPADPDTKVDPLSPRVLVSDPDLFYATLEQRLAASGIGRTDRPSTISPASRLIEACRQLAG